MPQNAARHLAGLGDLTDSRNSTRRGDLLQGLRASFAFLFEGNRPGKDIGFVLSLL